MVDIDTGNVYITSGSISGNTITGGTTVKIESTKIDINLNNEILQIPIPVSSGNRSKTTPFSRAIDLKRIKEVISVQGFLADEANEAAYTKRDNLVTLAKTGNALKVVWGQSPYQTLWQADVNPETNTGVFINKLSFTETAGMVGLNVTANPQRESNIAVQVQLMRGKDLV